MWHSLLSPHVAILLHGVKSVWSRDESWTMSNHFNMIARVFLPLMGGSDPIDSCWKEEDEDDEHAHNTSDADYCSVDDILLLCLEVPDSISKLGSFYDLISCWAIHTFSSPPWVLFVTRLLFEDLATDEEEEEEERPPSSDYSTYHIIPLRRMRW